MAEGFVHTVHKDGGWTNTEESGAQVGRLYETKVTLSKRAGISLARVRRSM